MPSQLLTGWKCSADPQLSSLMSQIILLELRDMPNLLTEQEVSPRQSNSIGQIATPCGDFDQTSCTSWNISVSRSLRQWQRIGPQLNSRRYSACKRSPPCSYILPSAHCERNTQDRGNIPSRCSDRTYSQPDDQVRFDNLIYWPSWASTLGRHRVGSFGVALYDPS